MTTLIEIAQTTSITLTLPWDVLVSDNGKYGVYRGKMILTKRYREAKDAIHVYAMRIPASQRPLDGRLRLRATIHEPNYIRCRDIANFAKLTHDGLNGILFHDDAQLDDVRWIRGPVDKDDPRVDIVLSILHHSPHA
jgi:Holliday junction resolvase RusA-like endonuclease